MIQPCYGFFRDVIIPAAIKAALAKPLTKADKIYLKKLKEIYDGK